MTPLSDESRARDVPPLVATGWQPTAGRDAIRKVWRFANFSQAWGFMSRAALEAERLNHHPEWRNVYNVVDVTLSTHDCDGLSDLDIALAKALDRFAGTAPVAPQTDAPVQSACQDRAATRKG